MRLLDWRLMRFVCLSLWLDERALSILSVAFVAHLCGFAFWLGGARSVA